ncbi:MAG: YqgE/AlgH family protein [Cytophagales bacterium]|nr:YqgE/AlgH family protein [Bernardetiaceae bacterium]MDW8210629.1 YqgE/AlgH family protein [Cytophagales bacterium]
MIFGNKLNRDNSVAKGNVLIAEPFLPDGNFERTVVLLCEHDNSKGTFGLILNKPTSLTVSQATELIDIDQKIYIGGPVEQNTLHFIHTFADLKGCVPVKDGVFWGGDIEQLSHYSNLRQLNTSNCRFFVGYSGWAPYQLANEIEQNSWIIYRGSIAGLFEWPSENMWQAILRNMGGKYKVYANFPEDPRLN